MKWITLATALLLIQSLPIESAATICVLQDGRYSLCDVCGSEGNCSNPESFADPEYVEAAKTNLHFNALDEGVTKMDAGWFRAGNTLQSLVFTSTLIAELKRPDFRHLKKVSNIYFQYNNLTDIKEGTFDGLANLNALYLNTNEITELVRLGELPNLKYLHVCWNNIKRIRTNVFAQYPTLDELRLDYNEISLLEECAFCSLGSLQTLSLHHNYLDKIVPLGSLPELKTLSLSHNRITEVPANCFAQYPLLQWLNLDNNQIVQLQLCAFCGLNSLTGLYLDDNQLTVLPASLTKDFDEIQVLNLENNFIIRINSNTFIEENTGLSKLYLNNNNISLVEAKSFQYLKNLTQLHLQSNNLESLRDDTLEGLEALEYLHLNDNHLSCLPEPIIEHLKSLASVVIYGQDNQWNCSCLETMADQLKDKFADQHDATRMCHTNSGS